MLSLNAQAVDTSVKQLLLSLSDEELVKAAMNGRVGKCSIVDAKNCSQCFCDFYAKTSKAGLLGEGLPHGYGSGCIVAPDSPRRIDICWGAPNVYDQYNNSKTPICGRSLSSNAANMIRIGIERGLCDLPEQAKDAVVAPVKDPIKECLDSSKSKDEEIRTIKMSLEGVSAELVKQKKTLDDERKQNQNGKNECEGMKLIVKASEEELRKARESFTAQASEIVKVKKQMDDERKQNQSAKNEVDSIKQASKAKDEELRKTKDSLASQSNELEKQKKQIESERKQQHQELNKVKDQIRNQTNKIQSMTKELENYKKQMEEEKAKNSQRASLH